MPLKQANRVLHQQVALHLHDCSGRRPDEIHHKVVSCLAVFAALAIVVTIICIVLVKVRVVERHFNRCACLG